ncbi:MAG: hypothetical protein U5L09_17635 [Bacteroidales bacterium]|nr:hypothetical protein [Bacteroidales bacterium]
MLAITGPDAANTAKALLRAGLPNAVIAFSSVASEIPVLQHRHSDSETRIFVWHGKSMPEACRTVWKKP